LTELILTRKSETEALRSRLLQKRSDRGEGFRDRRTGKTDRGVKEEKVFTVETAGRCAESVRPCWRSLNSNLQNNEYDIDQAIENFKTSGPRYAKNERYYRGDHDLAFATENL
jgi:hypothetical protein